MRIVTSPAHKPEQFSAKAIDWPTFIISGGFLVAFVVAAIVDIDALSNVVNTAFATSTRLFGAYWQVLLLSTFLIGLYVAFSSAGTARLGNLESPEISTFKWFAIIMCTLLAGGGVFFAAAEPMAHFTSPPPMYDVAAQTPDAVFPALAQSYMHWGFLAWAILGSLTTIVFMHLHYDKGLPLKPRTLLYPVFGERAIRGWIGGAVDAACVVAVVAGTVGPIGFLGLQVSYGLNDLFGLPNTYLTQSLIILFLIGIYTVSTVSGIQRGIQMLSTFNVILALFLMAYMLILGPTSFIFDSYIHSTGLYLSNFIPMATFRADTGWLSQWTVFFWGWFLGYGPLMAMFIARISNGRRIREIIVAVSLIAPVVTTFWFTIVGGAGVAFELANPGVISEPFEGFNMPAALLAITQQLPFGFLISVLFLILTTIFVATTGDSMTYTISMVMTGTDDPPTPLRIFWGVIMGVVAMILISIGAGGIGALQYFIVVTAVPVSLILLPSLWVAPKIARELAARSKN
ncbi:MAG: BCCT family transporter [Woeseiaceae bacterium]|nr:BCCT family transporter [Woeseiaceae bacterium]